jgi:hypothetical protein
LANLAAGNISVGRACVQGIILGIGIANPVLGFGLSIAESLFWRPNRTRNKLLI